MMTASPGERSHSLQDRTALFVHYHTETVTIFTEIQISTVIFCVYRIHWKADLFIRLIPMINKLYIVYISTIHMYLCVHIYTRILQFREYRKYRKFSTESSKYIYTTSSLNNIIFLITPMLKL